MKQRLIILFLVLVPVNSFTQSISDYIKNEGGVLLAHLAHPTSNFESGDFEFTSSNTIRIKVLYDDGYRTIMEVRKVGSFFVEIEVVDDTDYWPAFLMISTIKDIALEMVESNSETTSKFERYIGKEISEMNGSELACLILTLSWFAY